MKKTFGFILIISTILLFGFVYNDSDGSRRTEEYAILNTGFEGTLLITSLNIEGEQKDRKVYTRKEQKQQNIDAYSIALKELKPLNEQGFELVNLSTTYTTISVGGGNLSTTKRGTPQYTFMLKRKVN